MKAATTIINDIVFTQRMISGYDYSKGIWLSILWHHGINDNEDVVEIRNNKVANDANPSTGLAESLLTNAKTLPPCLSCSIE